MPDMGLTWLRTKIVGMTLWSVAYICIKFKRRSMKPRFNLYDMDAVNEPVKTGILPPDEEKTLESPHDESHLNKAADEVIFYGVNSSSESFMARISRRCSEEVDVGLYLKLRDGYVYQLEKTCFTQKTTKCNKRMFSGGGLKMYYTEPMRKWRILYKGLLRRTSVNEETATKEVYVKFVLQWRASTDCFDTLSDTNSSELAGAEWNQTVPDLARFENAIDSYSQCGVIRGEIWIDGVDKDMELYFFGEKIRNLGNALMIEGCRFSRILGHITKNGRVVHVTKLHTPEISLIYGYVVTPEGKVEAARNIKVKKGQMLTDNETIHVKFRTNELKFSLITNTEEQPAYAFGKENECILSMKNIEVELNSDLGRGILIEGNILKTPRKDIIFKSISEDLQKDIPLVVGFSDSICQVTDVSGGKGSSIGKLTELSEMYNNFIVPKGIVVTTSAYENFATEEILKEINYLSDVLYGNSPGDLEEACKRAMDIVIKADIPKTVCESITENLLKEFGETYYRKMFAVRSSATGEDSEDLSAAGQMETFLGVAGLEQIISSVKKCWASQFSHIAVQYKKQNGQVLNSAMAVVIQEMVLCDIAGVLFTCDPLTGNPTLMSITANYGLGESVVSGSEEPDTIVLERSADGNLKVKEKTIGSKNRRTIIKDGGLFSEELTQSEKSSCSLTDSLSLCLGKIAVNIEENYGSERDIEWGYLNDHFYIFQSRHVTGNNEESDYDIDHENDAPMRVENEYFSVCNVGEVMPGATSPLGHDLILKLFNTTLQTKEFAQWRSFSPKYFPKGLLTMSNHVMTFATDIFEFVNEGEAFVKSCMIAYFGRILEDDGLLALSKQRYQLKKKMGPTKKFRSIYKAMFKCSRILKKAIKHYESHKLSFEEYKTSEALYAALIRSCSYPTIALAAHFVCSQKSTMGNMLLMSVIEKARGEIDADVYSDLAELLSSVGEIESADVPSALQNLAYHIQKDISVEIFQKMNAEDAENWLMTSTDESGQRFRDFLKKHGHRSLKEFDIRTPRWEENPKPLIKLLQNLAGNVSNENVNKTPKSFEEITSRLKIPLSTSAKTALKYFLLPFSQTAVRERETSKSLLIKALREWRNGYRKLAKLMVSEGRIPEEDLLFFMSLSEIQELLNNRAPKIITRASRRKRRHPVLDSYIFTEISCGVPKPVKMDPREIISNESFSMKGIPVSRGTVKGFLRVALTLDEASSLQPGEILLTYSTDIGWSPYFPTLAGVGTELGGLISHGAVVSREYGLPCIAGLHGATRQFQTGDYVLMDANNGILQKLPPPE